MHNIHAIIVRQSQVSLRPDLAFPSKAVSLAQGFCLIPVNDVFHSAKTGSDSPSVIEEFEFLTDQFKNWLANASDGNSLAYIETDYFGGVGGQGAILFSNGQCIFGPRFGPDDHINEALRLLGVVFQEGVFDEFQALGLGEHRSTSEWLSSGAHV